MHAFSWTRVVGSLLTVCGVAGSLSAQTLTLPNGSLYKAGPDYATEVLQDPWDFNNIDDITPDPEQVRNWTSPDHATIRTVGPGAAFLSNGQFSGVPGSNAGVALLYRADAAAVNTGRTGARYPVDTARYRKLAFKMRVAGAPGQTLATAFWYHSSIAEPNWENRRGAIALPLIVPPGDSTQVYVLDLAAVSASGAQYTAEALLKGFELYPTTGAVGRVDIDWVRLTASDSQNESAMSVSLGGCSAFQSLRVTDSAGTATIITDSSGNNTSRSFNYGILPPGSYTIQATCGNGTTTAVPFTINSAPIVTVTDPDEVGDPATDYALQARGGDAWDLEQLSDVARTFNVAVSGGACGAPGPCGIVPTARPGGSGNMLRITSAGALGDPGLELLDGAVVPLNSRRQRLLTFSMRNNRPYLINATDGAVLRVLWGSQASGDGYSMTVSQDLRIWPGFKTYTIDLASLTTTNGGIETECAPTCPTAPWTARGIRHFRFDPHEYGDVPTTTDIDDMTLTAPDEVALGQQFTVHYTVADADSAGATYAARVYREDWATRTGRTLIANLGAVSPGALTYALDPLARGIPAGRYALSVEVDENRAGFTQTSRAYATGPLVVSNPSASSPTVTVLPLVPTGQIAPDLQAYRIQGCAYDAGAASGIGMDDLAANAIALSGQRAGRTIPLGFVGPPRGTMEFGPLGTPVVCASVSDGSQFRNSGFRFSDVGLEPGAWLIRIYARSTVSGQYIQYADIPVTVGNVPLAPESFQASAAGNTVTVSWQAPSGGAAVASYLIEGSTNPTFAPVAFALPVGAPGSYSGQLASGTYYLRVMSRDTRGTLSAPSPTRRVDVALPSPPGAPALVTAQVASNPILLTWSAGAGGSPTSYTVYAGTSPGASNLAVAPMGLATSIAASAPSATPIYVRVVAANAAGQATSNEVAFTLAPPAAPTLNPASVANRNVTLRWTAVSNAASYTVIARLPGSPAVIASLPVTGGTTVTVPAPPGTYLVTVVANNGQGTSAESNQITIVVP